METIPVCPKSKRISVTYRAEGFPTTQKLSLKFHNDIIRTKAVATMEGVWKGVYRPGELLKSNYRWLQGIPVTILHPEDGVTDSQMAVGQVVGVEWDDTQNRAITDLELWASKCPPELITKIEAGESIDVSTGYYAGQAPTPGKWGDQPYSEIEKSLFFDHLAIVPLGACTSSDGCGIGAHTGLEGSIKSHEVDEKHISSNTGEGNSDINMVLKLETVEDLEGFAAGFPKLEDPLAKSQGAEALTLLATQAKGKTGLFTPPKIETPAPAKVTYPMPKMIKAQDDKSLTLTFEPTEDPEAAKGAFTALYGEALKTITDKDALIKKLTDEKAALQGEKDAIEGGVRTEQMALIQAHSGLTEEEMKVYSGLPLPQLKAVATHMGKVVQTHSKDPKTKFLLPEAGGKKLSVAELDAEFDKALGFKKKA